MRIFFISVILIIIYFVYIRPRIEASNKIINDSDMRQQIDILKRYESLDPRSFKLSIKHTRVFMNTYVMTHGYNATEYLFHKMLKHYKIIQKYINKIPFKMYNCADDHEELQDCIRKIIYTLESYLHEVANKMNINYNTNLSNKIL